MLHDNLLLIIFLLFGISMLALLSEKIKVSYPILLVIAGLVISFIPGVPAIHLDPDLIFIIFLPPLLYAAAWSTSWSEFWSLKRPIALLAFGLVIFTATAVAFVSHWVIPDFTLAMGFLLGGIISPPDAVAAASVFSNLQVPKRVVAVLEGESLINDASSLIVFRFALIALLTGQFMIRDASLSFLSVVVFGVLIGLAIGQVAYLIHKYLPTTATIDTGLTLITPYLMYLTAEHFKVSGVLAVVTGGLFLSYRSADMFSYNSRLQSINVWTVMVFLMNGIVFIMIGLQLPEIIKGLGNYAMSTAIGYAVLISLVTIVIRLVWVYPAAYLPRLFSRKLRQREGALNWKSVFIVGWSGMRGVVSLASALAVPLTLTNGDAFPHRSLILFITFTVILFTLVLQGLSLPVILKLMKLTMEENNIQQENEIRLKLASSVVAYMDSNCAREISEIPVFSRVRERYEKIAEVAEKNLESGEDGAPPFAMPYQEMLLEIINVRRTELAKMHKERIYDDHLIKAQQRELDLEEANIRKT